MAATPSPLPIPGQSQQQNPLSVALAAVANGVPQIDPEVANGIAQANANNPDQAVEQAQGAQGFVDASTLKTQLEKESGENQRSTWQQLPAAQQSMLKSAGYNPPTAHRSLFGSITHDLGQGVHDVLNAAGSPLRAVQHAERTLLVSAEPQGVGGGLADILKSPGDWAKAWRETSNGEHYVTPNVQAQVQQKYGDQTFQLALKVAEGQSPASLIGAAPAAQQQQLAAQIQSPTFQQAVAALNMGKVSLGRNLVQVLGINSTGKTAQTLSGLLDAVTDWYGDPVNIGLKGTQAFKSARYYVDTGERANFLYKTRPEVQAGFEDIAKSLSSGSPQQFAEMVDRHPQLQGVLDQLVRARLHTADDVASWFADNVNLRQIVAGKPVSIAGVEGGILPHLTSAGQARLWVKGQLQKAIDYMADGPAEIHGIQDGDTVPSSLNDTRHLDRLQTVTGRSVRHLLTLTPAGDKFNPYSPNWFQTLRNVAMMSLTREQTNQFLYDYAHEATIGGRRAIYASLLDAVMKAAGVDHVPGWSDFVKNAMDPTTAEDVLTHSSYGPNGIDLVMRNGRQDSEPILDNQLSDQWIMPNYKTLYAQTKKTAVLQATTGVIDSKFMDTLMNEVWKPMALARFGFSLRVAGEEAFGAMLRAGPTAILRARAAGSALAHRSIDAEGTDPGIVGRMWGMMTDHLPQAVKDKITSPTELVAAHAADATKRAMANVQSRLAGSAYDDTARWAAENGILGPDGAYGRFVSATERPGNFYDASMPNGNLTVKVWDHGKQVAARMKPTGGFAEYENTNTQFTNHWYGALSQLATSKWGRAALESRGMALPERMQHVADTLMADKRWLDVSRSMVHDGLPIDASDRAIAMDHAHRVIQLADAYTKSQDGSEIPGLADHLLDNRKSPTVAALDLIDPADRPAAVSGPELVPVQDGEGLSKLTNSWTKGVNAMFGVIGKQIDWISRQPMFIHNLAVSRKAFEPIRQAMLRDAVAQAQHEAEMASIEGDYFYHGTTKTASALRSVDYSPSGIYNLNGPGFYTTEDPTVAFGYRGGATGAERFPEGGVYRLAWKGEQPPNLIDLEANSLPDEVVQTMAETMHDHMPTGPRIHDGSVESYRDQILREQSAEDQWTQMQTFYGLTGLPDAAQSRFWEDLHNNLESRGYDGLTHVGGRIMGAKEHQVSIFFGTDKLGAPVKATAATHLAKYQANIEAMMRDSIVDRALTLTTPFIHNPELRSQFEVITRNLMPFMFAQEQFYKRWARTMVQAPWAFRQAQLINQGVYHSGFTHTDPTTGQRYFVYPGAGAVQDVLTRALGAFGYQAFLPIEANLRGQVKMASPGLERVGLPSFGPLVVVPLKVIQSIFPEADGLSRQTATQSYMSSLVPATVQHIWQDFTASPNNSPQFASAMMQAIQMAEATGHGIGEVATTNLGNYQGIGQPTLKGPGYKPGDYVTDQAGKVWVMQADDTWRQNSPQALNAYMNRIKNWTRIFLITRTIFGFNAPASPENLFDPSHVNEDFQTLLKELPYQQAVASFMQLHPNATAYTVFQTKNQAGGTLPATASAMQFMDSNSAFFHDHPLAGAFFVPQQDQSGKYDQQAYLQQLEQQLRVRRTPQEFWQEIAYQNAANTYFASENTKNQMLNSGYQNRNAIDEAWTTQSQQFFKANPLFAQQLEDAGGQYNRANIENDLANALNDPRLPETPQTEDIRTLFNSYVTYQAMTAPYGQPGANTMSSSQRYQIEVEFATQVTAWIAKHPDALGVFQRLVQPDLSAVLQTEASSQVAA